MRAIRLASAAIGLATLTAIGACEESGAPVRVTIPQRASFAAASDSLARAGVIRSAWLFRTYARFRGANRRVRAGTYLLRPGTAWSSLITSLRDGKNMIGSVTIPEGFALSQIVPLLSARLNLPAESLWTAVRDSSLRRELDVPTPTLEGYLFPDTYDFPPGTSSRAVVATMVRRFERAWQPQWSQRLDSIPMSRHDAVTLASIVEKEAKRPEERPVIAAVYLNRLRSGMLLQADPTVQYALGEHQSRVYYHDLTVVSPYNTYVHKGLPPGPIASPGAASLQAAVYPASVPFRYFVAFPDGHHEFRASFSEHEIAKRRARAAWDSVRTRADSAKVGNRSR